jgi:hypothetical protein
MTRRLPILTLAGLLLGIFPARADTITVTSGGLNIAWDDASSFAIFGSDGFALSGLFIRVPSSPQQTCFSGCTPGTTVNLSSVAGGAPGFTLGLAMTATIGGVVLANPADHETWLNLAGTFLFNAPNVVLPPFASEELGRIGLSAPFTFQGQVAGFAPDDTEGEVPLFQVDLIGQGTALFSLSAFPPGGTYRFPEVSYTFHDAAPIPEPASMVLFGTAVAGLLFRRRTIR